MNLLDFSLLIFLLVLLAIAVFTRYRLLRTAIVFVYLIILLITQSLPEPLIRAVSSRRQAEGRWTEDFRDGVFYYFEAVTQARPYTIVSGVALAVLALKSIRRPQSFDKNSPENVADGNRSKPL